MREFQADKQNMYSKLVIIIILLAILTVFNKPALLQKNDLSAMIIQKNTPLYIIADLISESSHLYSRQE